MPCVSIGLPVYNGENFLEEALDSILAQSFSDFELIISDNASSDQTESICRSYANRDKRICYFRNTENLGAAWNFNRVFKLSSGEYFKWAAHDDVLAPDFLEKCKKILDSDSSVVLCYSKSVDIDAKGKFLKYNQHDGNIQSFKANLRFRDLILINHSCLPVFGLIRKSKLEKTKLIGKYVASDRVLLAELGMRGRFHELPEVLFYHREHSQRSTRVMPLLHSRLVWFDPKKKDRLILPFWKIFFEYMGSISRVALNHYEKTMCYFQLIKWIKLNWRMMLNDVFVSIN